MPGAASAAARERLDLVIANAENAADGSGITPAIYHELIAAGVDCITLGDHIYRRKEILPVLATEPATSSSRPTSRPPPRAATGPCVTAADGVRVGVFSLLGRVYMRPVDCPFTAADRVLGELPGRRQGPRSWTSTPRPPATSSCWAGYLDGRVSAVLGTHTHVATADEQILPGRHRLPVRRGHDRARTTASSAAGSTGCWRRR